MSWFIAKLAVGVLVIGLHSEGHCVKNAVPNVCMGFCELKCRKIFGKSISKEILQ